MSVTWSAASTPQMHCFAALLRPAKKDLFVPGPEMLEIQMLACMQAIVGMTSAVSCQHLEAASGSSPVVPLELRAAWVALGSYTLSNLGLASRLCGLDHRD